MIDPSGGVQSQVPNRTAPTSFLKFKAALWEVGVGLPIDLLTAEYLCVNNFSAANLSVLS